MHRLVSFCCICMHLMCLLADWGAEPPDRRPFMKEDTSCHVPSIQTTQRKPRESFSGSFQLPDRTLQSPPNTRNLSRLGGGVPRSASVYEGGHPLSRAVHPDDPRENHGGLFPCGFGGRSPREAHRGRGEGGWWAEAHQSRWVRGAESRASPAGGRWGCGDPQEADSPPHETQTGSCSAGPFTKPNVSL